MVNSNSLIGINVTRCRNCEEVFFEIEDSELYECPHCHFEFGSEENVIHEDSNWYRVTVNALSGVVSIERTDI